MPTPPPLPTTQTSKRRQRWLFPSIIATAVLIVIFYGYLAVHFIVTSGITRGPDNLFGDQHLKTAVALIELHKVRFGTYPDSLRDLRYTGQWDQIAIQSVQYIPNTDHTKYFVEVEREWKGKPTLQVDEAFWRGTGYSASLEATKR